MEKKEKLTEEKKLYVINEIERYTKIQQEQLKNGWVVSAEKTGNVIKSLQTWL